MTQGHSAPRQLPKLYFEEAVTVGILRVCPVGPRRLSCALPRTGLSSGPENQRLSQPDSTNTALTHPSCTFPPFPQPRLGIASWLLSPANPPNRCSSTYIYRYRFTYANPYIYIHIFIFYVYIFHLCFLTKCCAFGCCLPPRGSAPRTLPSPRMERWALPPAAARGGWECTGCPKTGLCYCGFFRMRPCLKS